MAFRNDSLSLLIAQRCQNDFKPDIGAVSHETAPSYVADISDQGMSESFAIQDYLDELPEFLDSAGSFDFSDLLDLHQEDPMNSMGDPHPSSSKRKASDLDGSTNLKKSRQSSMLSSIDPLLFDSLDGTSSLESSECMKAAPTYGDSTSCYSGAEDYEFASPCDIEMVRPASPCSDTSEQSFCGMSVEYHFQKIEEHIRLAVDALRQGRYEHHKSVVTWAHDLKNKNFSELKKEAERLRDSVKDKDGQNTSKPKTLHGSTKRVEQFRKNMRRWMIGTQAQHIGVEWMVYARMEHLQAISKFVLGDALPSDPASPTAVAESIMKYLGKDIAMEFVETELAEPEPGKRYAIGPQLANALQAMCPRKVPTLAFTMPPDSSEGALTTWVSQLKSLFPSKPAPKPKAGMRVV